MVVGCLQFGDHATPRAHFRDIESRIYVLGRHPCDLNVHNPMLYFYFVLVSRLCVDCITCILGVNFNLWYVCFKYLTEFGVFIPYFLSYWNNLTSD